jgi:hypothetical protein
MTEPQHHIHHAAPIQTDWDNVFYAIQNQSNVFSPLRKFSDGKARAFWSLLPSIIGPISGTTEIAGTLYGTPDGIILSPILTFSSTAGSAPVAVYNTTPMPWKQFIVAVTAWTPGTALGYRIGAAGAES